MTLLQLAHVSRPARFDAPTLIAILTESRRNNSRLEITGSLICRSDFYAQLIEGPEVAVRSLYAQICRDERHTDVILKFSRSVGSRLFRNSALHDDPATPWMWTKAEVADGAPGRASTDEMIALFDRVRAEAET